MISSATCWRRSRGRSCVSRRSPTVTSRTGSRRCSGGNRSAAARARHCIPSASRPLCSSRSAALSVNIILPASTSRPPRRWAAAWSRRPGSGITRRTSGRTLSSASCRAGTPPTRRPSSAISACARAGESRARNSISYMSRAEARRARAVRSLRREDKASGTQLIQELVEQGLHAVTRYQQFDKVMRMHAQTAMIENGFVHLPKEAGWLAEYLHELTIFPNGKHDDQVDSTAQMLDWFKQAGREPGGFYHYYRTLA